MYIAVRLLHDPYNLSRRSKDKDEYAVHYVTDGPKVDTTAQYEPTSEPEYAAGLLLRCLFVYLYFAYILFLFNHCYDVSRQ